MAVVNKPSDINKIWADGGDKVSPSDVKIGLGWEVEVPPRQYFNWLDSKQDQAIAHINQHGIPVWDNITEYQANKSYVQGSDGIIYQSLLTHTNQNPTSTSGYWIRSSFLGDTNRINVASANPLNLAVAAPNTRHINITGTTSILGFTVQAGRCYFVRFDGVLTLANNANIVTQRGAPIITAPGDTCIIRATADNVVEVLCYATPTAVNGGIVGASRSARMLVTASSATGTFEAHELIVATDVDGQQWRLSDVSATINLDIVGAGGMDTGLAPVSGWVALYVIYNPSTNTASMLAQNTTSTRATEVYSGSNMPAGYTASALVSVVRTDSGGNMLPHLLSGRVVSIQSADVLDSNTQRASPFALNISATVPINAKRVSGYMAVASTALSVSAVQVAATSAMLGYQQTAYSAGGANFAAGSNWSIPLVASDPQKLYYTAVASGGTIRITIFVSSYEF